MVELTNTVEFSDRKLMAETLAEYIRVKYMYRCAVDSSNNILVNFNAFQININLEYLENFIYNNTNFTDSKNLLVLDEFDLVDILLVTKISDLLNNFINPKGIDTIVCRN